MPEGASLTAEVVCYFRAVERHRPAAERVLDDPYAERFLSRRWQAVAKSPLARLALTPGGSIGAGALQSFVAARHRFMDDRLRAFLADGGEQVVILGAGYDTRALRFADALGGRPIYEVDFPATQQQKKRLVHKRIPEAAEVTHYLPIDFEKDRLADVLAASPLAARARTFFVWEGVAMYLTPEAITGTLAALRSVGGPGSELVLDVWSVPAGRSPSILARRWGAKLLAQIGEPLRHSLSPMDAPGFFAHNGWPTVEVLDSRQLADRYAMGRRAMFPDNAVVHARI